MQQVLQNLKTGETSIENIPVPLLDSYSMMVQTQKTLVSSGTEKMLVDFGRAGIIGKIKKQPDKVRMVLDKVKADGLLATYESVQSKLDQPIPLGYCNVGKISAVGSAVHGFKRGDRVVSNGSHAEVVRVSPNLCCKIPDSVSDEDATFTVMGAIALQGIRIANPTMGETFAVMGLGLIGLLTVQLLRANGCRVIGIDYDQTKIALAQKFGAETFNLSKQSDLLSYTRQITNERGVDGVIMTLSTDSQEPIHNAAQMCRKRGRIILVGISGLHLLRSDFYEKELSFQVSCSYGPGRYDPLYEERAQDYPFGFVRWTAQRNMEAFLELLRLKLINVEDLVSHRFDINEAEEAYKTLYKGESSLGIVLNFNKDVDFTDKAYKVINYKKDSSPLEKIQIGFIGSGNYAVRILLPSLKKIPVTLNTVCSSGGVTAAYAARKFGFLKATTDYNNVIGNPEINTVFILTRHNSHADLVCKALQAGQNVFVEKPLALSQEELDTIENVYLQVKDKKSAPSLMVGFNRRFSPFIIKMKEVLSSTVAPKSFIMRVNAGDIPADHWTQDLKIGGGRIIGEACHFVDLLRFLAGSKIKSSDFIGFKKGSIAQSDCGTISLTFEDGSCGVIHYLSNGPRSFPKERLEVFVDGKYLLLDNFRTLKGSGWGKTSKMWRFMQDKGQDNCLKAFYDGLTSGRGAPIAFNELIEVSRVTVALGHKACL
jgi:predicted dehydrogenase/threonine dehydrogenase-like Zn-dependent dehydrogenase